MCVAYECVVEGDSEKDFAKRFQYAEHEASEFNPFNDSNTKLDKSLVQVSCNVQCRFCEFCFDWQAIDWIAERSAEQVNSQRDEMLSRIEEAGEAMRASGMCDAWFGDADSTLKKVAGSVNGPLMKALLEASGYESMECLDALRRG